MIKEIAALGILLIILLSLAPSFSVNPTIGDLYADVCIVTDMNKSSSWEATLEKLTSMELSYDGFWDEYSHANNRTSEQLDLLLHYSVVILHKSGRLLSAKESSTLESYLAAGGNLLVTGVNSLGSPNDPLLASVVRSKTTGDDKPQPDLYVSNSTHPIMNGPYGSFPTAYHIANLPDDQDRAQADPNRGAVSVARLADGYDKIIATQTSGGRVVYWNGEGIDDWTYYNPNCTAMFKNAMKWLYPGIEHDLAADLELPTDVPFDYWGYLQMQLGWTIVINATVYNKGRSDETNVMLQFLVNGSVANSVTIPQLRNGTFYRLSCSWKPTTTGAFMLTAYVLPLTTEKMVRNNIAFAAYTVTTYDTEVYLDPGNFTIGEFPSNFTTTVRIKNASNMYGYEVSLVYDHLILNITRISFLPDFVYNYTEGRLTIPTIGEGACGGAAVLFGDQKGFSGDGILFHIEGTVLHSGISPLQIYHVGLTDPEGTAMYGAHYSYPSGNVNATLLANNRIVTVTPSYPVESWNFTSPPNTLNFNLRVMGGRSSCTISIPLDVMNGSFSIVVDENFNGHNGYSADFNSTHVTLMLSYELTDGVHNIKIIESPLMYPWGDINADGVIDIRDITIVAINFGKKR